MPPEPAGRKPTDLEKLGLTEDAAYIWYSHLQEAFSAERNPLLRSRFHVKADEVFRAWLCYGWAKYRRRHRQWQLGYGLEFKAPRLPGREPLPPAQPEPTWPLARFGQCAEVDVHEYLESKRRPT